MDKILNLLRPIFVFLFVVRGPLTIVASPVAEHRLRTRRLSGHGSQPSRSAACGIFPDRGTNPRPLHRQADSQPLRHQGSPLEANFCMIRCFPSSALYIRAVFIILYTDFSTNIFLPSTLTMEFLLNNNKLLTALFAYMKICC